MVSVVLQELPVAVIGAGPVGLAAAAELVSRDQQVVVFEQSDEPAAGVRTWGHVRLFSPWSELTSPAAEKLLAPTGWTAPNGKRYPTGTAWITDYLAPLAAVLGDRVRTGSTVVGVSRLDRDLLVESGRDEQPFVLHVQSSDGSIERVFVRAVIDATGTLSVPNPLGSEGYPVSGETAHADRILYGMPDATADGNPCAGKAVAVVGSGASALTSLIALTSDEVHTPGHGWCGCCAAGRSVTRTAAATPMNFRPVAPWAPGSVKPSPMAGSRSSPGSAPSPSKTRTATAAPTTMLMAGWCWSLLMVAVSRAWIRWCA
ncbi:FAD-dependent oxidoreductase [Flexivirga alba]|uniref:FAD-dependent oxidoreductase n=1 Tax=Flexivirga alba TaxID=702742 RepID=A0ABW2AI71_9MICO